MATEKRLIDANELVPYLWALFKYFGSIPCTEADKATQRGIKRCIGEIKKMPTVDAVEVVRCKDCKHYDNSEGIQWCHLNSKFAQWGTDWHSFPEDGFCSYGERKDNETTE